jgi:GntR family transcriptional regulator, transcriptional repressor for pyruvate dehydrogenase complex
MAAPRPRPPLAPMSPSVPLTGPLTTTATESVPRMATQRLSDQLAQWLVAQLEPGGWSAGDRLPTEQQLAQTHGVSRTVVREAVHQLKSRGLLRSRQGSGVFVAESADRRPLDFDTALLGSLSGVVQVVEVRRALEGEIAALAAARATRAQVTALRRSLKALDAASAAGRDGVAEDLAFHHLIAHTTGNPQFSRLLAFLEQYLREAMRVTRGNEARHRAFARAVRAEHHALVDAIAAGDATLARRAAVRHMQQAAVRLSAGGVVVAADIQPAGRRRLTSTLSPKGPS